MVRTVNQFTATKVQKVKAPGMYLDGAGLYLQVIGEAKSWILRFSLRGKARQMGLGSLRKVSLADARRKAADCHKLLDDHIDPIERRAKERAANALASATKTVTFAEAAAIYIASHRRGLKNPKHADAMGRHDRNLCRADPRQARRSGHQYQPRAANLGTDLDD